MEAAVACKFVKFQAHPSAQAKSKMRFLGASISPAGITDGAHAQHDVQVALAGRHKVAPQLQGTLKPKPCSSWTDSLQYLHKTGKAVPDC